MQSTSQSLGGETMDDARRSARVRGQPQNHEEIVLERLVQLRRSRSGHAADVTRKHGEFREHYEAGDVTASLDKFDALREAFKKYEAKHNEYLVLVPDKQGAEYAQFSELMLVINNAKKDLTSLVDNLSKARVVDIKQGECGLGPDDSVSQHSSRCSKASSASSVMARAAAKKAALKAKTQFLKRQQQLEFEQLKYKSDTELKMKQMDHQITNLKLQSELEAATAEEETLARFMGSTTHSVVHQSVTEHFNNVDMFHMYDKKENVDVKNVLHDNTMFQMGINTHTPHVDNNQPLSMHDQATSGFDPYRNQASRPVVDHGSSPEGNNQPFIMHNQATSGFDPYQNQASRLVVGRGSSPEGDSLRKFSGVQGSLLDPFAAEWVGPAHPTVTPDTVTIQQQLLDVVNLPKATLMTFDGEPTKFPLFMNAFDNSVGKTLVDDGIKLNRLFEYCKGKAAKLIEPCALLSPSAGYQRARELLTQRYGNEFQVSEACVNKVIKGPQIRPNQPESLQDFTDELRGCVETLRALKKLDEIDTRSHMVDIVHRLPLYIQTRWRKLAVENRDIYGHYPTIDKLLTFLDQLCREVNDPVYGTLQDSKVNKDVKSRGRFVSNRTTGSSFNVNAENKPSPEFGGSENVHISQANSQNSDIGSRKPVECYSCKGNHRLTSCKEFQKLSSDRKLELVREKKLCYGCLETRSHWSNQCTKATDCGINGCSAKHSKLLHNALSQRRQSQGNVSNVEKQTHEKAQSCASSCAGVDVALPIVAVKVRGKGQEQFITTYALLDPGSNKTFCSQGLLSALGMVGEETTLTLETLSNGGQSIAHVVSLDVTSTTTRGTRKLVSLPRVYALSHFPDLSSSIITKSITQKWEHLSDINVPLVSDPGVTLLIGQDIPQALIPLEVRHGSEGEPYAVRTTLGWSISGPVGGSDSNCAISNFIQAAPSRDHDLIAQVERFWKLDFEPGPTNSLPMLSVDDNRVLEVWNKTTHKEDNHYVIAIPFKERKPCLPNNRAMAEKRLRSLGARLNRDQELRNRYCAEVQKLLDRGFAEPVVEDNDTVPGMVWYLPHHPVINPNKPGKLRIVFDCAAQYAGTSLNKQVLQGPDMTNKLIGVLLRFRESQVAMMSDIEAMFHQIIVPPEHRDALRFLWWPNGDPSATPVTLRMTVHLFGGIWSPSCAAYALRRTAEDNKANFSSRITETVLENFYVDDCLKSESADHIAVKTAEELCQLLQCGGFRLTKWTSNSRAVLDSIPEVDRLASVKSLDLERDAPVERALGVLWNTVDDTLGIQVKPKDAPLTKRGMLSLLSSVYDPLGLVSPYVLLAKKLFQHEVRSGKGWDEDLSPDTSSKWRRWLDDLPVLEQFRVGRCMIPSAFGEVTRIELHHFCDASQEAYGAVSYLRVVNDLEDIHCSLVMAKSRLAPIKTITIPRLELLGAVLAVKLDSILRRELAFDHSISSTFWTDSIIVLQYIENTTRRFQTFVANRVAAVHEGSDPSQWRYVNTELNPADDASRGLSANQMVTNSRWPRGPEFLWLQESAWPVNPQGSPDLLMGDKEVKLEAKTCAVMSQDTQQPLDKLLQRYSSWLSLKKGVAWMIKFKRWLLDRHSTVKEITVDDLQAAEVAVVRYLQLKYYGQEVQATVTGMQIRRQSAIYSLEPTRDADGILRVGGRLHHAPVMDEARHPVILPRDHHVTTLVVRDAHERLTRHSGREHVLAEVRQHFWVPRCRTLINKIIRDCVICKKTRGALAGQRMADLPVDRVTPGKPPFCCVGIDCFGPFYVKRGRSQEKRYGCIFTCMAMRAVHLEKLHTMESDSFINALMRFIARRGVPEKIRSDNGTNFVGADRELRESIQSWEHDNKVKGKLLSMQIRWEYNPPAASHMGGVWERQIRTVRKVLNVILRDQVLDDERLDTMLCEVESIVNSRPLTAVSDDPQDLKPLTPNDMLLLRYQPVAPPGHFQKSDMYSRRWRHIQYLADQFWRRWLREYLPTLQLRQKWIDRKQNLAQGDMVLVAGENTPRKCWPLGRITQAYSGKDGLVRSAEVQTSWNTMVRPVDKLCPLDISAQEI